MEKCRRLSTSSEREFNTRLQFVDQAFLVHRYINPVTYPQATPRLNVPLEDDRRGVELRNAFENARLQLVYRVDPDMAKEGARHFGECALNQIEPRPMLGRVNVFEAPGSCCQPREGFFGDMVRVVVQHQADDRVFGIVLLQAFEQGDEFHAAVAVLNIGEDLARVQINTGQNRYRALANIFVVAPYALSLAGYRWQIGRAQRDRLNTGLVVDADGVDGVGLGIMRGALSTDSTQPNVLIHHQHFLHLAFEVRVALLQVVTDLVRLDGVVLKNASDGAFTHVGKAGVSGGLGPLADEFEQCREAPQLGCQAVVLGLGTGYADDPGPSLLGDLGFVRAVVFIFQPHLHTSGQYLVNAPIDHRPTQAKLALKLCDRQAGGVTQQHPGSLHFANGRGL